MQQRVGKSSNQREKGEEKITGPEEGRERV